MIVRVLRPFTSRSFQDQQLNLPSIQISSPDCARSPLRTSSHPLFELRKGQKKHVTSIPYGCFSCITKKDEKYENLNTVEKALIFLTGE